MSIAQPNARNTDPFTSVLAGEAIEASGTAHNQRMQALAAVKAHPGLTSKELAEKTGLCRFMLARRLPEVKELRRGDSRKCSVGGLISLTWWPV